MYRATGKRGFATALAVFSLALLGVLPQAALATFPGKPGVIVFNLDSGGWRGEGQLYAIQPWQTEPRQLTWNEFDSEPSFAPSGQRFVFLRSQPGRAGIYQYDMVSGRVTRLVRGRSLEGPAFGRKGMIAFTRDTPIGPNLFLRTADGRVRRLTSTEGPREEEPVFTPNGRRIVFLRRSGSFRTQELWSIRTDGTDLRLIDAHPYGYRLDISPNGRWLALQGIYSFNWPWVGQRSLRSDSGRSTFRDAAFPTYSPGGGKIALSNYEGLWLAPVNGDENSKALIYRTWDRDSLTTPGPWPQNLAWQPLP